MTGVRSLCVWGVAALVVSFAAHVNAAPPAERLAPLKEALEKKIRVQFLDTPLDRALEALERDAETVTFVIDQQALTSELRRTFNLRAESMSIRQALDWVTRATGTDWDVRDGVVLISTPTEVVRPYISLHVYDVRALTTQAPNFNAAASLSLNSVLSNTNSGGSAGQGVAQAATSIFGDDDKETDIAGVTGDDLVEVIQSSVPDGRWTQLRGVSVSFRNGLLTVTHTPEIQSLVRNVLERYQEASGRMVSLEAHYLVVRRDVLEEHLAKAGGSGVLDGAAATALLKAARAPEAGGQVLGVGRTTCFNGQRVNVSAGNEKTFVSDVEPIPGAAGVDPTLSVLQHAAVIDLEPVISFDNKTVTLLVRGDVVAGAGMETHSISVLSPPKVRRDEDGRVVEAVVGDQAVIGVVEMQLPDQDTVTYRTMVRLPSGGAVVLSASSSQFRHLDVKDAEVVMLVKATALK